MKSIKLRIVGQFNSSDVIKVIASRSMPEVGINIEEMRLRCRILESLEQSKESLLILEDADCELLIRLTKNFSFSVAAPELLTILDDILKAQPYKSSD